MKLKIFIIILSIYKIAYTQEETLDIYKVKNINNIISLFNQKNIDSISNIFNFPLKREYPIPSVKNAEEFKKRFHDIFDQIIIEKIANSKMEQWNEVGWRGIMLDNGDVWIDSDEGKIIALNYQSDFEKSQKRYLIETEKYNLYRSLRKFELPIYKIATKHYLIRIDKLSNNKYRYAWWKLGKNESSKPDIILNNGSLEFLGTGGNLLISFSNGNYKYNIYRNIIGEESSLDITLEVHKKEKILLKEDGNLIE